MNRACKFLLAVAIMAAASTAISIEIGPPLMIDAERVGAITAAQATNIAAAVATEIGGGGISWTNITATPGAPLSLSIAPRTAYFITGSGALDIDEISGLTPDAAYMVAAGFDSISMPQGFEQAGAGVFRSGRENHLTLWQTPGAAFFNFLISR